jgi:uncharacterized protein YutE (UPF0331/DUF86 family)
MSDKKEIVRFYQMMRLVDKEALHLEQVTHRFFDNQPSFTLEWLAEKLLSTQGIDQLESFTAKFSRLQDTLGDKLLPHFLKLAAEPVGTAIENLNRAEKLGLIPDAQLWLGARQLRNLLIHEYIEDLTVLKESLEQAKAVVPVLIKVAENIKTYAQKIELELNPQ